LVIAVAQSSVAELHGKKEIPKLERMIQGIAFVAAVPSGLMLLAFILFGGEILRVVYGPFYTVGLVPLIILGAGNFLGQLLGPAGMVLMMTGKQKYAMIIVVATNLLSILMVILFVKPFGLNGVALAWGLGSVLYSAGMWLFAYKTLGIKTHVKYFPEILSWKLNKLG
jgi:O-antigen/teichoic acid export membrane protein